MNDFSRTSITPQRLALLDRYFRAANYLAAGQVFLQANPLLQEPLKPEHIKPRLLGHWGTDPGLNLIYVHLNRLICDTGASVLYVTGPGHGAPAILANLWLEGSYSEYYPEVSRDANGMLSLFRRFSTPGGVPSHVSAQTPGSIHEGGELGYSLLHAFGAAFDNPELIVACVVGDGEAETGPAAGAWKSTSFLNPARDGAVLPILHLNGYKISGPTVQGRTSDADLLMMYQGHGYDAHLVSGDQPGAVHAQLAATLDSCYTSIRRIQSQARKQGVTELPRWPMIILRTPKGWTGPRQVGGLPVEGTFRAHQVPLPLARTDSTQLKQLKAWLRSYRPQELFSASGVPDAAFANLIPADERRMGVNPCANGGARLVDLELPDFSSYAFEVPAPGTVRAEATRRLGEYLRDIFKLNADEGNFRLFCPDETNSNRLGAVFDFTNRCSMRPVTPADDHISADGRVMEVLSEHCCEGWLEGYLLTGRHGIFPCYEAFATIVDSMMNQHAKWLKTSRETRWRRPVASLNYLLTSHAWRQDHNGYSHQGPGFVDSVINKKSSVTRIYFPPDGNCLLTIMDHCLRSRDCVNVVVAGKQPELQWLNMEQAREHCSRGIDNWSWAGHADDGKPDIVLACAGDVPTLETLAAAELLRQHVPDLKVRVVNVVDLMTLSPPAYHPHGIDDERFLELFTADVPVVFAFHGYPRMVHDLVHGRPRPERFHVRGYMEEGTTTTPFDMVVANGMSRFHLAMAALRFAARTDEVADDALDYCEERLQTHARYILRHLDDMPEIRDWSWSG